MKNLTYLLALFALISCGSDNDDDDDLVNVQLPQEEEISSFSTRINNNLLIAGTRCEGDETTIDSSGTTVNCARDEWLVTLDNVNTCTDQGLCTEIAVVPFVAELDRVDRADVPDSTFFEIDPISAITPSQEEIIDDYLVRFDLNDETATVIPK